VRKIGVRCFLTKKKARPLFISEEGVGVIAFYAANYKRLCFFALKEIMLCGHAGTIEKINILLRYCIRKNSLFRGVMAMKAKFFRIAVKGTLVSSEAIQTAEGPPSLDQSKVEARRMDSASFIMEIRLFML
jgi:hypothetical protein